MKRKAESKLATLEVRPAGSDLPPGMSEDTKAAKQIARAYEHLDGVPHWLSVSLNQFGEVILTDMFENGGYEKRVSVVNIDGAPRAKQWRGGLASEKRPEGEWQAVAGKELQSVLGRIAYAIENDSAEAEANEAD